MMEQLQEYYRTKIYNATGSFFCLFLLCVCAAPFMLIWFDFGVAFKLGITGIVGMIITICLSDMAMKVVMDNLDREVEEMKRQERNKPARKTFQQRMDEIMEAKRK